MGYLIAFLVIVWALLWRRLWLEEARRRDTARIQPIRYRQGWEKASETSSREFRARRDADNAAIAAFAHERRSGKPRLHRVS